MWYPLRKVYPQWGRRPRLPQIAERQPRKADQEVCPTARTCFRNKNYVVSVAEALFGAGGGGGGAPPPGGSAR